MIIVEGPDGAGKTTLVKTLTAELGLEVGERATQDRNKLYEVTRQDTYTALGNAVFGHTEPLVWDRLYYSELVYAPIVGREPEFSFGERVFIQRVINALGCPVICCLPPFDVALDNALGTEQMDGVKENFEKIYTAYKTVFSGSPQPNWVIWYDYTDEATATLPAKSNSSLNQILSGCESFLINRKTRSW